MFGKLKDMGVSKAIKVALNQVVKDYGKIENLTVDTKTNSLNIEITLDGDYQITNLFIQEFNLIENNNKHYLKLSGISVSKKWMNSFAQNFLENKMFEIPEEHLNKAKAMI